MTEIIFKLSGSGKLAGNQLKIVNVDGARRTAFIDSDDFEKKLGKLKFRGSAGKESVRIVLNRDPATKGKEPLGKDMYDLQVV